MPHDTRHENHIFNKLYDNKNDDTPNNKPPETLSGLGRLQHAQQQGGQETDHLQIGHHVEQPDKEAQQYGQRQPHDGKAYAEKYAHQESHTGLPTEIAIHAHLHIVEHFESLRPIPIGYQSLETDNNFVIIKQYEYKIKEYDKPTDDIDNLIEGTRSSLLTEDEFLEMKLREFNAEQGWRK